MLTVRIQEKNHSESIMVLKLKDGCLCISGRLQETLGNLLIALPADLLLIYTYVRDRKSKKDKERDKQNEV